MPLDLNARVSRRRALAIGGGAAAGSMLAGALPLAGSAVARERTHERHRDRRRPRREAQAGRLPVDQIQEIIQAQGTVTKGVLDISISRDDIGDVSGPEGVTFTPAFEINGDLTFQPLGDGRALYNGDLALKPEECNPVIDALIANQIVFQAFHQHYIETSPNIWFIHSRAVGDPLRIARGLHNVLKATSTPLPQTLPANPHTPLDPGRLASILHGEASVGEEGVVTVDIDRSDDIFIERYLLSPETNIFTQVQFKPLSSTGSNAAVGADFSMTATEIQRVVALMRKQGWFQGCLYNQETGEHPQLYFDHMLKVGDAYALAEEIRRGLDLTDSD